LILRGFHHGAVRSAVDLLHLPGPVPKPKAVAMPGIGLKTSLGRKLYMDLLTYQKVVNKENFLKVLLSTQVCKITDCY
jgi:hypothetical protein